MHEPWIIDFHEVLFTSILDDFKGDCDSRNRPNFQLKMIWIAARLRIDWKSIFKILCEKSFTKNK